MATDPLDAAAAAGWPDAGRSNVAVCPFHSAWTVMDCMAEREWRGLVVVG